MFMILSTVCEILPLRNTYLERYKTVMRLREEASETGCKLIHKQGNQRQAYA